MANQPIYSIPDSPSQVEKTSTYEKTTPWKNSNISFLWTNFDYPFLHNHEHWELFIIYEGTITHYINGKFKKMYQGEACIIRPSDKHKLTAFQHSTVKTLNFVFKKELFESLCSFYNIDLINKKELPDLSFKPSASRLHELSTETILIQSSKSSSLKEKETRCKILLNQLIGDFLNQKMLASKSLPPWIEQMLLTLSDPLISETSIKKELSATTNYSYSNMIRLFKKYTGYTIIEYIQIKKIDYATDLLLHSDKRIIEITSLLGYDSVSHFNRLFKRYTGVTPTEFRKKST